MNTIDLHSDIDQNDLINAQRILELLDPKSIHSYITTKEENDDNLLEIVKSMVKRWISLDKEMHDLNERVKNIKDEKKQFEDKILLFMNKTDQNEIIIKNGKISKKEKELKETINEEYIKKCLSQTLQDADTVNAITKLIVDGRTIKKSQSLEKTETGNIKKNNK